jgi:hypothetical protein
MGYRKQNSHLKKQLTSSGQLCHRRIHQSVSRPSSCHSHLSGPRHSLIPSCKPRILSGSTRRRYQLDQHRGCGFWSTGLWPFWCFGSCVDSFGLLLWRTQRFHIHQRPTCLRRWQRWLYARNLCTNWLGFSKNWIASQWFNHHIVQETVSNLKTHRRRRRWPLFHPHLCHGTQCRSHCRLCNRWRVFNSAHVLWSCWLHILLCHRSWSHSSPGSRTSAGATIQDLDSNSNLLLLRQSFLIEQSSICRATTNSHCGVFRIGGSASLFLEDA